MNPVRTFDCRSDFEILYLSVINNIDYFYSVRDKYWYANKFLSSLREVLAHLHWYEENLKKICSDANLYDVSDNVSGNGFVSFLLIFERFFFECFGFFKSLSNDRNSIFFSASTYVKTTESLLSILDGLKPGLQYLNKILKENKESQNLMADSVFTAEELIQECCTIRQLGFYGRHQGFYYCASMRRILQGVGVIVATFSDLYLNTGGPTSRAFLTVFNGIKYILDPERRAQQIVDVAQNSSVEFLKAFWSLSDIHFMQKLPEWICPKMDVKEVLFIPPEPISLVTSDGCPVVINPPSSHIPPSPVRCLLLSSKWRNGQVLSNSKKCKKEKASSCLLFHCHGGGFIAQNPESHEIYLRHWANDLNVPILSVDYSLAPAAPFPRALEEVLFAYTWCLKNASLLGWTGETLCCAGDSAGGNILIGMVLKIISLKLRLPNALLCAYTPLILDVVPSPSRLLCWIDPLLPLGFMISCLDAYAGDMHSDGDEYEEESSVYSISTPRSRKISSISEIFDSSITFLREWQWAEVEANEPLSANFKLKSLSYADRIVEESPEHYVSNVLQHSNSGQNFLLKTYKGSDAEDLIFDFPSDILHDVKSRLKKLTTLGFNKLSRYFTSIPLYQKCISILVPAKNYTYKPREDNFSELDTQSVLQKIKKLKIISKNPYMSPLLAPDEFLKQMPPIYFVSPSFDPCLDDSVTFAKRLSSLNCQVVIDVLDGLPHGFLNFLPFSQEAHNGSNQCVRRLKEAMKLV